MDVESQVSSHGGSEGLQATVQEPCSQAKWVHVWLGWPTGSDLRLCARGQSWRSVQGACFSRPISLSEASFFRLESFMIAADGISRSRRFPRHKGFSLEIPCRVLRIACGEACTPGEFSWMCAEMSVYLEARSSAEQVLGRCLLCFLYEIFRIA